MEYRYKIQRQRRRITYRVRRIIAMLSVLVIIGGVLFVVRLGQGEEFFTSQSTPQLAEEANTGLEKPPGGTYPAMEEQAAASPSPEAIAGITVDVGCPFFEAEMPILVNRHNLIPEDHDPDLVSIGDGHYLNRRAAAAWEAMRAAAASDGINLWIISAYRSHERQTYNFNNSVQFHVDAGRTPEEAHTITAGYIAVPGTSEHTLGMAIDLNSIDAAFEHTPEFEWLIENAANFGYIFRYPREATEITGINFEPWHFRYVGSNHARIIMELGIVLEEYLEMF